MMDNKDSLCAFENHAQGQANLTILTVAANITEKYLELLRADRNNLAKLNNAEVCIVDHKLTNRSLAWSKTVVTIVLLEMGR